MTDGGTPNYAEYSVLEKPTKKTRTIKAAIILAAAALFLLLAGLLVKYAKAAIIVLPMAGVVIFYIAFVFWKYAHVGYAYTVESGVLKVKKVYGGRKKTPLFETRLSRAEAYLPYKGAVPPDAADAEKVWKCVSSLSAPDITCLVFKDGSGKKCAAYIETPAKIRGALKFYNSAAYKRLENSAAYKRFENSTECKRLENSAECERLENSAECERHENSAEQKGLENDE